MEKIDNNSSSFLNDEKFLLFRISHIKKFVIFCFVGGTSAIIHLIILLLYGFLLNWGWVPLLFHLRAMSGQN